MNDLSHIYPYQEGITSLMKILHLDIRIETKDRNEGRRKLQEGVGIPK